MNRPGLEQWANDYPGCPMCGEETNIYKVGDELYRCGSCDEIYPDFSLLPVLAGVDLEDQLPKRGAKNRKRSKDESRQDNQKRPVAPMLGSLDREEQGIVDLTGVTTNFFDDPEPTEGCEYGYGW